MASPDTSHGVRLLAVGQQDIVVADPSLLALYDLIERRLALLKIPILIHGETGTGKELIAAALHGWAPWKDGPFVAVNCAALPDTLVESTLFGHRRGAFTGADTDQVGLIRAANGGTLFLDEVGELGEGAQAKLLRVLEVRRVRPVGETEEQSVDVRVVAATNRSLRAEVRKGTFRKDLFFRLRGAAITVPALRDRPLDIGVLAEKFLLDACVRAGLPPKTMTDGFLKTLQSYRWPGNVRELETAMNYLALVEEGQTLCSDQFHEWCSATTDLMTDSLLTSSLSPTPSSFRALADEVAELETDRMRRALVATHGRRNEAAALIGMPLRTFSTKLKQYGLDRVGLGANGP